MKGFTGVKDLDLKILMDLDDETLLNACSTNKELYRICNVDQSFWRNRYVKQYGEHAASFKEKGRSWKNHYMQTIIDLQKFRNPMDFFTHIFWKNNVDESFYNDRENKKMIPLKDAPEWVMNNLHLMKIPSVDVISVAPNTFLVEGSKVYTNITPIELLENVGMKNMYLFYFIPKGNKYLPNFVTLRSLGGMYEDF